jgi:hypothetical protein
VEDNRGVMLAAGLLFLWIAGVAFFTAFHPGGLTNADGTPAQNPGDVVKYLLQRGGEGASATSTAGSPA